MQRWDELTNSFKTVKKLTEDFCSGLFSPGAMSKVEEVIDCHFVERNENRREDRSELVFILVLWFFPLSAFSIL